LFFNSIISGYTNKKITISLFPLIINKSEAGEKKNKKCNIFLFLMSLKVIIEIIKYKKTKNI
jgi:hypothetical protein